MECRLTCMIPDRQVQRVIAVGSGSNESGRGNLMARKTGLGRGLGAIFGTDVVESVEESLHQRKKKKKIMFHVKHPDVKRYIQPADCS